MDNGMTHLYEGQADVRTLSPLALAYVGDGVYELLVRERLACEGNRPGSALHSRAVEIVQAGAQARAAERLLPLLSAEEAAVFRRGRNAHTGRNDADYHRATGLEALFGYLYLTGNIARVRVLFAAAMDGANRGE